MTTLTAFRQAVQSELAADLGLSFVPGKLEPPVERKIGCCWAEGKRENPENVNEEILEVRARVFPPRPPRRRVDPELPYDPTPLEELAEQIQDALKDKQATQFGVWFFRVTAVETDPDNWLVEAVITGMQDNRF